jgi:hypothetical protein
LIRLEEGDQLSGLERIDGLVAAADAAAADAATPDADVVAAAPDATGVTGDQVAGIQGGTGSDEGESGSGSSET